MRRSQSHFKSLLPLACRRNRERFDAARHCDSTATASKGVVKASVHSLAGHIFDFLTRFIRAAKKTSVLSELIEKREKLVAAKGKKTQAAVAHAAEDDAEVEDAWDIHSVGLSG